MLRERTKAFIFSVFVASALPTLADVPICEPEDSSCFSLECEGIHYNCPAVPKDYKGKGEAKCGKGSGIVGDYAINCLKATWSPCDESKYLSTFISGSNNDLILIRNSARQRVWQSPPLEKGKLTDALNKLFGTEEDSIRCNNDLQVNNNYATIRHGANLDLFYFVGINQQDEAEVIFVRLQDGEHLGVSHTDDGPIITLGARKNVKIKYCFNGAKWTSSGISRPFVAFDKNPAIEWRPSLACGEDYVSFFDGSTVQYSPKRRNLCAGVGKRAYVGSTVCEQSCDPLTGETKINYDECRDIKQLELYNDDTRLPPE